MAEGDEADDIIDTARRRSISRRDLRRAEQFEQISPDVGELDDEAVTEAMAHDPDEMLALLADLTAATDERLRALAKRLAARLFVDIARTGAPTGRGIGRLASQRYRPDAGDLDVDESLSGIIDARASDSALDPDELRIRTWAEPSTAWCLLVDRSGSMEGRSVATAGLAAAAVAARAQGDYAVLSFGRRVVAIRSIDERRGVDDVIDRVLALRGHGSTDLAAALQAAANQLSRVRSGRSVTVLLSDCRATEPGDVLAAAHLLDDLVIVAPEGDSGEAEQLAVQVGARWTTVAGPAGIVDALATVLNR